MNIPAYSFLSMQAGDTISFVDLDCPGLGEPKVDPDRPESFGKPNYDSHHFWEVVSEALGLAGIHDISRLVIARGGADASDRRPFMAIYYDEDSVAAVYPSDQEGHLVMWIETLTAGFGSGPDVEGVSLHSSGSSQGASLFRSYDKVIADPAAWLKGSAPNLWEGRAQRPEKERMLEQAASVAGPPVDLDYSQILSLWTTLSANPGVQVAEGARSEALERFAETTGFDMPPSLAVLLSLSDGAAQAFGEHQNLMSVDQILREWSGWKQIFDNFTIDDLTSNYEPDGDRTIGVYTTPRWVPFVDDSTGNFAAVDLLPGPGGRQGQIIYFGADEDTIRVIATDLVDYLKSQVERSQST